MSRFVTLRFVSIFIIYLVVGCSASTTEEVDIQFQQQLDSIAEFKIDSAYKKIQMECDSMQKIRLPIMVDSLLKIDSLPQ
jgi:hypothetical protein